MTEDPRKRLRAIAVAKTLSKTSKFIGECCSGNSAAFSTPKIHLNGILPIAPDDHVSSPPSNRPERDLTLAPSAVWSDVPTQPGADQATGAEETPEATVSNEQMITRQNTSLSSHASRATEGRSSGATSKGRLASLSSNAKSHEAVGEEELDLEMELMTYNIIRGCLTSDKSEGTPGENALQLRLYRTQAREVWQITRRMVITTFNAETQSTWYLSSWLPLSDIGLRTDGESLFVSWSDCNHKVSNSAKNFHRTHSKKYDGTNANNEMVLGFAHSSDCRRVIDTLCAIPRAGEEIQPSEPMTLSSGHSLHFFEVLEDCDKTGGSSTEHILLIRSRDDQDAITTRMYLVTNEIDFTISPKDLSGSMQYPAMLSGMKRPVYISNAQDLPAVSDRIGYFSNTELRTKRAIFTFQQDSGKTVVRTVYISS